MKRFLVPLAAAIVVVGLLPQGALAQPVSTTEHIVDQTDVAGSADICGETYDFTFTYSGVIHTTEFPDGSTEVHATFAGILVAEPQDGTGPTYSGRSEYAFNLGTNDDPFTTTVPIVLRGSDGSMVRSISVLHSMETPSGVEVGFEFENTEARCI
jgi:hypothetical protein